MRRILMLSWEYPPLLVGGLGRHVHALAGALAAAGHEVTVVTRHAPGALVEEHGDGVRVIRAPEDPPAFEVAGGDLLAWALAFNHTLTRAALRAARGRRFDVVHAHDWLVAHAAVTLRDHLDVPLVATVHATESGRHQGWLPAAHNRSIDDIERWLCHEANRVIVCSEYMRAEVTRHFEVPAGRVDVVPNGVDALRWRARPRAVAAARDEYAGTGGPLISFAGRLVYEKGVQHLLAAVPELRERFPGLRVVIAGDGPYRRELELAGRELGETVSFAGFLTGHDLTALMAASDCYVVPSIYEPFGMVAVEAAAAGTPVAVAATGGLSEIVEHGVTGVHFPAGDPGGLAAAVSGVLSDQEYARGLASRARARVVEDFNWPSIAARTAQVYPVAAAPRISSKILAARAMSGEIHSAMRV
ncbi:glycosyl transferase family 1 [Actinoplanes sp. SE50]|uniref:glycosyltransferase family 4 protein n=1 Tax=unclassified Actinoplanes TaxID=2626549 RepID=UPI00023EC184|nr:MULTISPECIES: glycosyltransferase family 4 protein [unclassified Actinoplanes]AEV87507.1 glycosyl transferase group 1 [Actinoplanes sp. SE50/110]ATO85910.1 glycosyl transferase family 1 [Actinoplanes sp. SE50]SLM03324.1 glycosyl transferase family 1 [Actinoplanes sp. SE50/110]